MSARRCSACNLNWPAGEGETCPVCTAKTWFSPSNEPMPNEEAASRKAHAEFERWLLTDEGRAAEQKARDTNDWLEAELAMTEAASHDV